MEKSVQKQMQVILSGAEEVLVAEELEKLIAHSIDKDRPLKVKLGLDPTAPDIHLGHTVVLNKLRQFQDLGHKAILIIGDYTARIGDPSGRSKLRPKLDPEQIDRNAETYMRQAFKILNRDKTEVVNNSRWLKELKFEDVLNLTSRFTVARMLERDDFKKRFNSNTPIAIMEFLYPIMQAYDSVAIEADVELGGTDQKFNLLMGRELQKEFSQRPQIAITMPILVGTDGTEKMSKSLGNYIGVNEPPKEIFGKVMSIPDDIMAHYFKLLTRLEEKEYKKIEEDLAEGKVNPVLVKRRLARIIIGELYSQQDAHDAEKNFDLIFKQKKVPDNIQEYCPGQKDGKLWIVKLLVDSGLAKSNGEARRLLNQGAVKIDSRRIDDPDAEFEAKSLEGKVIQKGKRHFRKIRIK